MTNQQIQQPLTPVVIGGVEYVPCSQVGGPSNLDALYRAERAAKQELGIIEQSTNVSPRGFFRDGYVTRNYLVPTANLKRFNELFDHPPGPPGPSEEELRQRDQRSKEASVAAHSMQTSLLVAIAGFAVSLVLFKAGGAELKLSVINGFAALSMCCASFGATYAARSFISMR